MTLALDEGRTIEDGLMLATAAGAATALTPVAKVCARGDVMRLYEQVKQDHTGGIPAA
jgi:fructose-1-phosphate kinase PfkB-like protein